MFLTRILLSLLVQFTYRISADECGSSSSKFGLWTDPDVNDHDGHRPDIRLAYRDSTGAQQMTDWIFFDNPINNCNDFDGGWDYHDMFDSYEGLWDAIYIKSTGDNGIALGAIKYMRQSGNLIETDFEYDESATGCKVTNPVGSNSFWVDTNGKACKFIGISLCGAKPKVFKLSSATEEINYCGPTEKLATDNACYSATTKATGYEFNPPENGRISGIKLVGQSSGVTCDNQWTGTYFGCGNGWGAENSPPGGLFIEMIEETVGGATTYYPTDGTNGVEIMGDLTNNCPSGGGCSVQWYKSDGYPGDATEIELSGPTYEVTTDQSFSIQYGEGCCEISIHDNAGEACAEVYFIYDYIDQGCPNAPNSFDWDTLTADGTNIPQIYTAEDAIMSISEDTLSLQIHVELEYEGAATGDSGDGPFGVTYVLDFEDFDAHKDNIYEPGTCQNRNGDDFENGNRAFSEWWGYSNDPNINGQIGSINTMAYPPQTNTFWTQEMSINEECGIIVYEGNFTWNELIACAKAPGGTSYVKTVDGPNDITLSGVFYINVVSPYAKDIDESYYRVYQLLSKPFEIRISKSVYVLGAAGINVLSMSIIAVYKENALIEPQNDFRLVVLTESQNYLKLSANTAGYFYAPATGVTIEQGDFTAPSDSEQGDDCLNNKAYICSQLWVIEANGVDCNTKGIDFSGQYTLKFDTSCRDGVYNEYCAGDGSTENVGWLAEHPDIDAGVTLEAKLTWKDEICDPQVFNVQFKAEMNFFTSADYTVDGTGTPDGEGDHLFQVGKDNIYVEINTAFASDTIDVFDTKLINVWICTFEPGHTLEPLDANTATGGCFDADRDGCENVNEEECFDEQFENPYFYHIYQGSATNPVSLEGFNEIDTVAQEEILQFYFTIPHRIARDTLYVQAQVEVTLQSGGTRRVLLKSRRAMQETANQMDHFIKKTGLTHDYNNNKPIYNPNNNPQPPQYPQQPINYPQPQAPNPSTFVINLSSPWIIAIGSLLAVILTFNIIFMCYMNCNKQQRARVSFDRRRRNGYSSVKNIESDVNDSEINAINVVSEQSD